MMEKLISIIVPVYNVEDFLENCIKSIIEQTYSNLEIILVDDGSKDNSGKLCDYFARRDKRIKIIHKKNGGLSSARNAGLEIATGVYIMFIDSDDFYEKNACEILYNEIEQKQADYVIGNYIHVTYDGQKWANPVFDIKKYDDFKLKIDDYKKSFFVMNSVVWNKIFKRDFIEKYKLRFIENAIAEDAIFSTYCYVHTNNAYFINEIVYNYRQNKENVSISTNCSKKYFEQLNDSYKLIFKNFEATNNLGFYRFFYARIMPYLLCKIIDTNSLNDEEIVEILSLLNWFFKQRELYNVAIINNKLANIVEDINNEKYIEALNKIKETKEYRNRISDVKKEKMYAPNEELYRKMSN